MNLSGGTLQVDQNGRIRTFQDVEVKQDGFLTAEIKKKTLSCKNTFVLFTQKHNEQESERANGAGPKTKQKKPVKMYFVTPARVSLLENNQRCSVVRQPDRK